MTPLTRRHFLIATTSLLLVGLIVALRLWVVTTYYVGGEESLYSSPSLLFVRKGAVPTRGDRVVFVAYLPSADGAIRTTTAVGEVLALPGETYACPDSLILPAPRRGEVIRIDSARLSYLLPLLYAEGVTRSETSIEEQWHYWTQWKHHRISQDYHLLRTAEQTYYWVSDEQLRGRVVATFPPSQLSIGQHE